MAKKHEEMTSEGICPRCGDTCGRDEVDVGVGVIFGPYGCGCGWSEHEEYDAEFGGGYQTGGGYLDPNGGFWPEQNPVIQLMRASEALAS